MLKRMILGAAMVAASGAALSHPHPGAMFDKADANNDGMVVRDEFLAARTQQFERMDKTADGFLDETDRKQAQQAPRRRNAGGRMHARMDADGDGKLSKDEFVKGGLPMFERLDADSNSVLDADELKAVRERLHKRRAAHPDANAQP